MVPLLSNIFNWSQMVQKALKTSLMVTKARRAFWSFYSIEPFKPVLPSEGRCFHGFTPQVHTLLTTLQCEGFGWPECAVRTFGYIKIWVMVRFWPADLELGLWNKYFYMHAIKKDKKETYVEIQNHSQNMFKFYDSLYGLWVKGLYWCSLWWNLPWKND